MKKVAVLAAGIVFMMATVTWANNTDALEKTDFPTGEYAPGELLVKYKPALRTAAALFYEKQYDILTIDSFNTIGVDHIKLSDTMAVPEALKIFRNDPNIDYVEPNYYHYATATPNDPLFSQLWGMQKIRAPEAWDTTTGSSGVVIAVIDSGVRWSHPDLRANMWKNSGEIPGNGIDDDMNGFVDDIVGWDFAYNDNNPNDENGHGTHVAGTIAAVGNNSVGVTGVLWNAKIMALRFIDANGFGTTANAIKAILYANRNGAQIQNLSWGGGGYSQALKDAIDASSAVFVAAAGNDGDNNDITPHYPSGYTSSNLIAVAATGPNDNLASISNFGLTSVDVAAPGVNIYSPIPGGYGIKSGTSMAAPHVSGLAGLIVANRGGLSISSENTIMAASDVIQIIKDTVDPVASLSGLIATGGRINAFEAVKSADAGGSGGCFIATAAFGSILEPHVQILRHFRDKYLKTNGPGRAFVKLYYTYSPPLAQVIKENSGLRWATRITLLPMIGMSWLALTFGALFSMLALGLLSISGTVVFLKIRRDRS